MKTYTKGHDKLGAYFKCKTCLARSTEEFYIKSELCHKPIIQTTSVIGKAIEEEEIARESKNYYYLALIRLIGEGAQKWKIISPHPDIDSLRKHLGTEVGSRVVEKKIYQIDKITGEIKLYE